jgi:hypothetical protein
MAISAMTGATTTVPVTAPSQIDSAVVSQIEERKTYKEVSNAMSTEEYVRQYFSDIPIMIQVAKCESRFRQLDKDGSIHRGVVNSADVGVMQINEFYHLDTAEKKDIDIYTLEGNTAYARDLYERQGTAPWISSKPCWGKYLSQSTSGQTQTAKSELAVNK